jgi:amino acid adenylation domain-containing protein/non-ribosomal peptide synthase protein (TIGR01720 family)
MSAMSDAGQNASLRVAIVGISVRLPGAQTPEAFWRNLDHGVESISFFSDEELRVSALDPALVGLANYVPARAILPDLEQFDAAFFGMTPREAAILDPQQRLLLECASEALDTSGCAREAELRPCGVYAGVGMNLYLLHNLWPNPRLFESTGGYQVMLGNDKDFCATRISYKLNLHGPSLTVQTACSSSLTAVHLACQALLQGECDLALAGGSAAFVPQRSGYLHEPGMILSPDGHCRPFDARAAGTVAGSGAAMIVLKRLDDALLARDRIHALIVGSAVNNDGAVKVGYTAPSEEGQRAVIAEAMAVAGVHPDQIGYVEAHGTGTAQGDPIEFSALTRVFATGGRRRGRCALGSVKSNLGHLDAAAGVTGLIKTVLALRHGAIPATLHFERPNPAIDLENSPFFIPTKTTPWDAACSSPRRAGVSSFGIGGSNVHVVLEQAPPAEPPVRARSRHAFVLSAKSPAALDIAARNAADWLEASAESDLADAAHTWNSGRRLFAYRRLFSAADTAEAVLQLRLPPREGEVGVHETIDRRAGFLFPGQGVQYPEMGRGLYQAEARFRHEIDRCADHLRDALGCDLRDLLFRGAANDIHQTRFAQPALFAVEYAMAQCLLAWGVRPRALFGHSLGEWVAACVAGVLTLEEALPLIALRGQLMQQQPGGAMLSVRLGEAALAPYLSSDIALAAVNAPALCSIAGSFEAVAALEQRLVREGIACTRLATSHAFHSAMMEPVVEPLTQAVSRICLKPPRIRILSNVTGRWLTAEEATDPRYWGRHVRVPVRCAHALETLFHDDDQALIDVGPGRVFSTLAGQFAARSAAQPILQTFPPSCRPDDEAGHLVTTVARLHFIGVPIDWSGFHAGEGRRRISLPAHPFRKERCWIEPATGTGSAASRKPADDWFYLPGWRQSLPPQLDGRSGEGLWLLAGVDGNTLPNALARHLRQRGANVAVMPTWPGDAEDWRRVLAEQGAVRGIILFEQGGGVDALLSLIGLAQALPADKLAVALVTRELHPVTGNEQPEPERALVLGALRVLPQEESAVACRQIDLDAASWHDGAASAERVVAEILGDSPDDVVAYRGARRWTPSFERIAAPDGSASVRWRERGVYLITGGLGGIGLTLAEDLARSCRARIVLVSRSGFPERPEWQHLAVEADSRRGRQARALLEIEAAGGEVVIAPADVADAAQMLEVVARVERRFGPIHGVIHAAGAPGGGVLAGKTASAARQILHAKVSGARVLDRIFASRPLDFLALCSSVAGWLGGFGQADYCAANLFLDAFAEARTRGGRPTFSILWDSWREVGMAVETAGPPELQVLLEEDLRRYGLSRAEGAAAFRRAVRLALPQVVVSTRDFSARYAARQRALDASLEQIATAPKSELHPRPPLAAQFIPPRSELEKRLAALWADHLGFAEIGIDDNYFDLGGDSLKAITLAASLERELGEKVRVATLFEAPTVADLARRFGEVPATQPRADTAIPCLARDGGGATRFEMSSGQRRLWFLHQLDPANTAYHMPAAMRISGTLDAEALAQSHREIIRRHETLRTTFAMIDGRPMQIVAAEMAFDLPVIDVSGMTEAARNSELRDMIRDCTRRPFDLQKGPLLRALLVRFSPEDHLWVLAVHHIVSDAWSMDVIVRETTAFYRALVRREPVELPTLSIQYADYATHQAEQQRGEMAERSLAYWRETLAGAPPLLALPSDRPRPAQRTNTGARLQLLLDAGLTARLKALARDTGGTLFTTLIAGFTALLARLSGMKDFVVATPTAGRDRRELDPLIGFFINNLMLRVDLSGDPPFHEHLQRTRQRFLDSLAHQDTPFDRLVETLQPPRNLSFTPLFQVMFGFMNTAAPAFDVPGLVFQRVDLDHETAAFDLTLLMRESASGLVGDFEYSTDLFDEAAIRLLGHRFERLLRAAVENPQQRVGSFDILRPGELLMLLETFNATSRDVEEATWPEMFEAQAARTPEAVALVRGAQALTYQELNQQANRLARQLLAQGLGPEDLVGICMERSFDLFIAMLGVQKAGAAYLPLDPEYPPARLAYMIEDASPAVVLCGEGLRHRLPQSACVWMPDGARVFPDGDLAPSERTTKLLPAHPAYVIYTSGSTGRPKGVVITHAGLASLAGVHIERLKITQTSRLLQFASFSFDSSVAEIVMTLAAGAALVLAPAEQRSGEPLRNLIRRERVTLAQLPPAVLATLAPGDDLPIEGLIVAGEACPGELVERWSRHVPMFNAYGPTESTVCATLSEALSGGGTPPIGRPVWNTRIRILDDALQPVPPGVCGQLYIAGAGLARGYLRRPTLTAERFLPDPYGRWGARMYATGDLARWRSDGTIDYLGRADQQVKLRGFRIEPGEIEAALAARPGVAQAVVVARDDGPAGRHLVAYIVPTNGDAADPASLRRELVECLPDYMVPTAWVFLSAVPLTPNGKVDRGALPAPQREMPAYHPPATPAEQTLCALFAEVLALPRVGVRDNFFDLGGDSILSLQLASRARAAGLELSSRQLFEHQTIAELALVIRPVKQADEPGQAAGPFPLTPIQQWFLAQDFAEPQHFNQAVMLEVAPDISVAGLQAALQCLVTKHDALRMRFAAGEGTVIPPADAAVIDVVVDDEAAIERRAAQLQCSLSLDSGVLMRVALFRFAPDAPARLLWIIHHLVVDAVSWRILLQDLEAALCAVATGRAPSMQPAPISFAAWARKLADSLRNANLDHEIDYWRRLARRRPPRLPLQGEGGGLRGDASRLMVELDTVETATLLRDATRVFECRHDDLLLTAVARAFVEWTGDHQVLLDLESHGREALADADLSGTVGWFTIVYPVCLSCDERRPLRGQLRQIRDQLAEVPNHGLFYGLLRYLHPDAALRRKFAALPQPEVLFNYFGQVDPALPEPRFILRRAREDAGLMASPRQRRTHLLEINAWVAQGRLVAAFTYDEMCHPRATVEALGAAFTRVLRECAAEARSPAVPREPPPSERGLDGGRLARLAAALQKADRARTAEP